MHSISIHAFRVEGDLGILVSSEICFISIHAFRVEGDLQAVKCKFLSCPFQSTPSVWKATMFRPQVLQLRYYFNPRLPCGRRLFNSYVSGRRTNFNPRLPCGRRLNASSQVFTILQYFNPRLPCGRRQELKRRDNLHAKISIHAFRVEGDEELFTCEDCGRKISIHAFRVEGD